MKLPNSRIIIILALTVIAIILIDSQLSSVSYASAQPMVQPPGFIDREQPSENLTATISIVPTLLDAIRSKIQVGLDNATTQALNSVGENSTAVLASIQPERGYLIYRIIVLDNTNNVHMILFDPANGEIVSKKQLPTEIMRTLLTGIPLGGPQIGSLPRDIGP
jgi:hypothetical protein